DLAALLPRHLPHLLAEGVGGALLDLRGLLEQHGGRRALRDEGEALVAVDGDDDGDDEAHLVLRRGVERLAELHDVDALLAEGRADGRCRAGLPRLDLQLDVAVDLLCHGRLRCMRPGEGTPAAWSDSDYVIT